MSQADAFWDAGCGCLMVARGHQNRTSGPLKLHSDLRVLGGSWAFHPCSSVWEWFWKTSLCVIRNVFFFPVALKSYLHLLLLFLFLRSYWNTHIWVLIFKELMERNVLLCLHNGGINHNLNFRRSKLESSRVMTVGAIPWERPSGQLNWTF